MTPEELQALWQQQLVDEHEGQPPSKPAPAMAVSSAAPPSSRSLRSASPNSQRRSMKHAKASPPSTPRPRR